MLKPFVMSLALTGLGVSSVGADGGVSSPAIWRWNVTQILAAQHADSETLVAVAARDARAFDQRYERYSVLGLPEPSMGANAK